MTINCAINPGLCIFFLLPSRFLFLRFLFDPTRHFQRSSASVAHKRRPYPPPRCNLHTSDGDDYPNLPLYGTWKSRLHKKSRSQLRRDYRSQITERIVAQSRSPSFCSSPFEPTHTSARDFIYMCNTDSRVIQNSLKIQSFRDILEIRSGIFRRSLNLKHTHVSRDVSSIETVSGRPCVSEMNARAYKSEPQQIRLASIKTLTTYSRKWRNSVKSFPSSKASVYSHVDAHTHTFTRDDVRFRISVFRISVRQTLGWNFFHIATDI